VLAGCSAGVVVGMAAGYCHVTAVFRA
jgi:hypothetical protein